MSTSPTESLTRSLGDLRFWALVITGVWFSTESLVGLLAGRLSTPLPTSTVNGFIFVGGTVGVAGLILWIGGVLAPRWTKPAFGCLCVGAATVAWRYSMPDFGGLSAPMGVIALTLFPLAVVLSAAALLELWRHPGPDRPVWVVALGWISLLNAALGLASFQGLRLTFLLFPVTLDHYAYRLDHELAPGFATWTARAMQGIPVLETVTSTLYSVLVPVFSLMIGVSLRSGRVHDLHLWRLFVVPFIVAWFIYWIAPICGPYYAFYKAGFPTIMPAPTDVTLLPVPLPPSPRNGMPSMHLSGAMFVFLIACALRNRVAVLCTSVLLLFTAWATLALGEHYLIDLVVALPFAAMLITLLIRPRLLLARGTGGWWWACAALTAAWLITIRIAPLWLISVPWLLWAASAVSIACGVAMCVKLLRDIRAGEAATSAPDAAAAPLESTARVPRWIAGMFFFSGVAGLLYEVVFSKALAVTFGSTALANYTVLATYMGGMAIGAWLGGWLVSRVARPLLAYAVCEGVIGAYALLTPSLFKLMQSLYVSVASDVDPASPWLTVWRVSLGAMVLGVPTVMMGATLPLMFKHVKALGVSSANAVARLYGANVLGAAVGSTVAGYAFLPSVGRNGATYLAAVASLMIALYAMDRLKRSPAAGAGAADLPVAPREEAAPTVPSAPRVLAGLAVLVIGGAITLGLEVIYMHLLAVVAGNSAYAFALMLSAFLVGLGIGSELGRRLLMRYSPLLVMATGEFALCASIAVTAHGWDGIPGYFAGFGTLPYSLSFSARETIRALVCLLVMIPPAVCIGMVYPAAMSLAAPGLGRSRESAGVGIASALNTVGNIAGVLLTGFVLLPLWGSLEVAQAFALTAFALGIAVVAVMVHEQGRGSSRWSPPVSSAAAAAVASAMALLAYPGQWNYQDLTTGANVYFRDQGWGRHVEHAESVSGGLTSVAVSPGGVHTLLTNGKFQGNNATGGEMIAQAGFALAPLLHTARRDSALVIGYGTGMTTNVMHAAGFKTVEMVELAQDIVTLADKYFESINDGVLRKPGVVTHITDGRNFLLTQNRQFDVISIEISSVWFAGAANLYNKEFYELARARLRKDGILQQWVQLHHIHPMDLVYILGSVRANFRSVWLYLIGGQGIIVAANSIEALTIRPGVEMLTKTPAMAKYVEMFAGHPEELAKAVVLEPGDIDRMISSVDPEYRVLASTDVNLFLEYSTPKGNALEHPRIVDINIGALQFLSGRR